MTVPAVASSSMSTVFVWRCCGVVTMLQRSNAPTATKPKPVSWYVASRTTTGRIATTMQPDPAAPLLAPHSFVVRQLFPPDCGFCDIIWRFTIRNGVESEERPLGRGIAWASAGSEACKRIEPA